MCQAHFDFIVLAYGLSNLIDPHVAIAVIADCAHACGDEEVNDTY